MLRGRVGHGAFAPDSRLTVISTMPGLATFALAEMTFVLLDWGWATYGDDPSMGFSAVHPLFVPSDDDTRYEILPSRQSFFRPELSAMLEYREGHRLIADVLTDEMIRRGIVDPVLD